MAHEVIKRINENLMASGLSTEDGFYKALWGDPRFTPGTPIETSADYNCGALANELEYAVGTSDAITRAPIPDDLPDGFLELFVSFFTGVKAEGTLTAQDILDRMYAVIYRGGARTLMTKWGIIKAIAYYFEDEDDVYLNENKITGSNLITDGVFDSGVTSWSVSQSGSTTVGANTDNPFQGDTAVEFSVDSAQSGGSLEQTVTGMTADTHFLSFFLNDDGSADGDSVASVEITRASDGYYYNFESLDWQSAAVEAVIPADSSERYILVNFPVVYEGTDDATIRIKNSGASTVAHMFYVDRFEFGVKDYPNIEALLISQGTSGGYLQPWENGEDPVAPYTDDNYTDNASFLNSSYMGGYVGGGLHTVEAILEEIKPAGVHIAVDLVPRSV